VASGGFGILSSGGTLASGGAASVVTVSRGGVFEFVGIDASHAPVNFLSGATGELGSGASLRGAQISKGITLAILSGATVFGGTISAGGLGILGSGGVVSSGVSGSLVVGSGGTLEYIAQNVNSAGGNVDLRSGATVELGSGASISGAAGELSAGRIARVLAAGTATDITIDSGAKVFVQSGGSAVDLTVLSGGSAVVSAGGVFDVVTSAANFGTLIESGAVHVASGGVLTLSGKTSVGAGVVVETFSGGTAVVAGTLTNGGTLFASGSGSLIEIVSGAVANGGVAEVGDGLVAILGSSSENVNFLSTGSGGLAIADTSGHATAFKGRVSGFGGTAHANKNQFIDLVLVTSAPNTISLSYASAASHTSGTLFVSSGGVQVAAITMVGHYSAGNFVITSGAGGTVEITDPTVPNGGSVEPANSGTIPQQGIALPNIAFGAQTTLAYAANAAATGGTLTVGDGRHAATIALLGNYMAGSFAAAADGHGGTLVTNTGQTDSPILAHPRT
jgi:hypothetical protein